MRNIRPFLDEFPLTPNTFQLSVGFIDEKGENFCPPYLVSVIMDTKNLEFNQFYKVEKAGHFKTILAKPLSNCTDLQECYHPIVKRSKPSIPPSVPTFSSPPVLTRLPADWTVFLFAKKMTADFGLNFVAFRNVYEEQSSFTPFQIALWGRHQLSLPEARKLTAKISHDFLHTVQTDKDALDFMQKAYNSPKTHLDALQPEKRHIALRLSFWDENIDRQPVPYIAEVRLYNEKITYYTADENQFLVPVLEESFDDAQAFSKEDLPK
jgi:hypothetical protein